MINFKSNIPHLDEENMFLFKAAHLLEQIGNEPNTSANDFYAVLLDSDMPTHQHEDLVLAAISIETMMSMDLIDSDLDEPTVH